MMATAQTDAGRLVFIVDDDESFRSSLQRLLRASGFRTLGFESAQELLRSRRPAEPACMVVDVRMPVMDGLELQRHLAATGRNVPILFVSAQASPEEHQRAMQAGAIGFLHKPVEPERLISALREV